MKKKILPSIIGSIVLLVRFSLICSQTVTINAGSNQIINWEKTHTAQLKGSIFPGEIKAEWTCPRNPEVTFKDPYNPSTEATFPRPGYYLLILSVREDENNATGRSVIVNVFKPNSYRERLSDMIGLMTVEEKINQLTNQTDPIPRLGIPEYNYWNEALHGVLESGATSFPQCVALGSSWDPELIYRIATAISDEARVLNQVKGKGLTYWSPTINIARDPRWGRNEESYSEDPYLLSLMGVAFIKGMQGNDPYYFKTISTPKHFLANNEEERRHTGSSDVGMRCLFEYYLPAFQSAVVKGRAYSVMGAYNEVNHVPSNANTFLLNDLLRRKWGFQGYVVSDCGAINDMVSGHHFFETTAEASARSILAGCDLECGQEYRSGLKEAMDKGLLEERDLDSALTRVLSARFRLGEFDPFELVPYSVPNEKLDCKEHRDLALEAAQKSVVLLKNNGILPLKNDTIKSIAVIGPNAADAQLGIYSGFPNVLVSPLEGIQEKAEAYGIRVEYTLGCSIGGGLLRPVEAKYFTTVEGTDKTGVKGEYYNNMKLSGAPVVTRIDSMIDFTFGTNSPSDSILEDKFSVRWKGKIIPSDTIYHIGTSTDDGSRLYLDEELLIDDWTEHGEKPLAAKVKLIPGKEYEILFEYFENGLGACARLTWDLGQKDFSEAKNVAARNDVVILVLGTSPGISQEELDRKVIELPQVQRNLIAEVESVNPNIIVVLVNGGPVALAGSESKAKAIIEAWYPGEMGGHAIADVLFGHVNPGGKLPETFYASTQQLPPMSDYDIINHPRTYMYFDQPVLYPFGHGLSYTQFEYSNLRFSTDKIKKDGEVEMQFEILNSGNMKGDEVAQVYVYSNNASIKVPFNQLKRFQRLTLLPGEKKTLMFTIPASEFSFYDTRTNDFKTEPGQFEIQVGSSSADIRLKKTVTIEN
jgi:beta-glucosidase